MKRLKHLRALTVTLVLGVLGPGSTLAQTNDEANASLRFDFSNPGAASLGLGGAFTGIANDATAAYAGIRNEMIALAELVAAERGWEDDDYRSVIRQLKTERFEDDNILEAYHAANDALEAIKAVTYPFAQVTWLQSRFPAGEFAEVAGLCKVVSTEQIKGQDWSLTPGRYVGVAPPEPEDEDSRFVSPENRDRLEPWAGEMPEGSVPATNEWIET